ncbi:MAG: flavodoxin-dependent (E)-4-hydroxy-3-methylbut-2-enyl-diphosphate synthase, partial [Verrucomicrobiota bacterium]
SKDQIDPFTFEKRTSRAVKLSAKCSIGGESLPAVIVKAHQPLTETQAIVEDVCKVQMHQKDSPIEGLLLELEQVEDFDAFKGLYEALQTVVQTIVLEVADHIDLAELETLEWPSGLARTTLLFKVEATDAFYAPNLLQFCRSKGLLCALHCSASDLESGLGQQLQLMGTEGLVITLVSPESNMHPVGSYRALVEACRDYLPDAPIWIRNTNLNTLCAKDYFSDRLLESSILTGALLCDGVGDLISIETEPLIEKANALAYNILQGARARISKTEFVACPSCGRTLFDLQSVTQKIRSRTDHLKGVTIAIMGCIVNGPGEMADADFGYVGGAPGKINLYVGKECIQYNVPAAEALDRLIDLIQEHGKWVEPS